MEKTEAEILWGADEIAAVIHRSRRQTFAMLEKGQLPAKKVGGRWVAKRSELLAFLSGATGEAA